MLKKARVQMLFSDLHIWLHIVGKNLDLKIDSFFCQFGLNKFQDLGVRNRGCRNRELLGSTADTDVGEAK